MLRTSASVAEEKEVEDEDWETDDEFYEWTVFTELETMNYFCVWTVDGLHRAEVTSGECQFFTGYVATRRNWDLTLRMRTLENISSGGVISDNIH